MNFWVSHWSKPHTCRASRLSVSSQERSWPVALSPLAEAASLLPLGIVIGLLIPVMLAVNSVLLASILLITVGAMAGYFVVPMNALLQHRGCNLLTAGRSIAVQGFNENAGMLVILAIYAAATATDVSLETLIWCFAAMVTLGMAAIYLLQQRMRAPNGLLENS